MKMKLNEKQKLICYYYKSLQWNQNLYNNTTRMPTQLFACNNFRFPNEFLF
jgi:hypothetical protein